MFLSCSAFGSVGHTILARAESYVLFGGRLGEYKYYDMDKVIESAMKRAEEIFG